MSEPTATPSTPAATPAPLSNKDAFYPPAAPAPAAAPVVDSAATPAPVAAVPDGAAAAILEPKPGDKPVVETPPATVEIKKEDLKLPEGSLLDAAYVEKIASFAKEQGFSKEQAQKVLERESDLVKSEREAGVKAGMETFQKTQAEELKKVADKWFVDAQNDKDFGGDKFPATSEKVLRTVQALAGTDYENVKRLLDATYLGNHPSFVRMMLTAHDGIGEDQIRGGKIAGKTTKKSDKEVFYGNMKT